MKNSKPKGFEAHDDFDRISVVTTESCNRKTGDMAQLWILGRNMPPTQYIKLGLDSVVCGQCKHRPSKNNSCYVNVGQAPNAVWRSWLKGNYSREWIASKKPIRLGAYGDPAFVPISKLRGIVSIHNGHTGYTHEWAKMDYADTVLYSNLLMASVDNETEYHAAKQKGWRTFRVRPIGAPLLPNEINCPSDKIECAKCKLCCGTSKKAKDISIEVHGSKMKNFEV